MTAFDRLQGRLVDVTGYAGRNSGGQLLTRCPAHEDRGPSLTLRRIEGSVLVYCHAGCAVDEVLTALNLTRTDLYDEPRGATYLYDSGRVVHRTPDKQFWQSGNQSKAELYHLARLGSTGTVYLVEGEKDVHAVESLGGIATTAPMGAANFVKVDVSPLAGRNVIVVVDRDAAGQIWAVTVATKLAGTVAGLRFVEAKVGKDVADHIAAGHDLHQLNPIDTPTRVETTAEDPPIFTETQLDRLRAAGLDSAALDNIPEPEPLVYGVLYVDSLAWLIGRPGHGKTLVGVDVAGSVGTGLNWQGHPVKQGPVLYLIAEGVRGLRPRVRAWEAAAGQPMVNVTFLPVAVQAAVDPAWQALCAYAKELGAVLVIVDTQARISVGMEENSAKDMGLLVDRLERLRVASGACVLVLHHTPRSGEHLRGSTALEGAAATIIKVVKEYDYLTLTNDPDDGGKQKDAEPFDPITLRLIQRDSSVIVTASDHPQTTDLGTKIVRQMLAGWWQSHGSDEVSISVLVKTGICTERTFHNHKKALLDAAVISRVGKGNQTRYHLIRDPSQ